MPVRMTPTNMKMVAMTIKKTLQLAEMKRWPMLMATPVPSSLDSILNFSMTESGRGLVVPVVVWRSEVDMSSLME